MSRIGKKPIDIPTGVEDTDLQSAIEEAVGGCSLLANTI